MFGDRLKLMRQAKGYTQQSMLDAIIEALIESGETAKEANTSISTYRNWEQNIAIPNSRYLKVIAPLLGTTTDYLLGISKSLNHERSEPNKNAIKVMRAFSTLNPEGQSKVCDYVDDLVVSGKYTNEGEDLYIEDYTEAYTLGAAAAGDGYAYGDPDQQHRLFMTTELPMHDFSIDVKGDSMFPTIMNGDVAFVKKDCYHTDGKIYVLDIDAETVVKRVYFDQDEITLKSDNPEWKDRVVSGAELESTRILGEVIGWETPVK